MLFSFSTKMDSGDLVKELEKPCIVVRSVPGEGPFLSLPFYEGGRSVKRVRFWRVIFICLSKTFLLQQLLEPPDISSAFSWCV